MTLKQCCSAALDRSDGPSSCPTCGQDLSLMRHYMQPSATWGGGVVIPMAPFKGLQPDVRRRLSRVIQSAVESTAPSAPVSDGLRVTVPTAEPPALRQTLRMEFPKSEDTDDE